MTEVLSRGSIHFESVCGSAVGRGQRHPCGERVQRPYATTRRARSTTRVSVYWCPSYGHPDGDSDDPWFRVEGEWGFRASGHPEGASSTACLRIVEGLVYPTFGLPRGEQGPCFVVVGPFVYEVGVLSAPWFHVETRAHPLHPAGGERVP